MNCVCRGNHTTSSAILELICMSEFFKKYQNLNFLKNSRVQINFKLNEKRRTITYLITYMKNLTVD